ncbi:DUF1476 domain-containing protein [Bradyrhizobium sp. CCGUVB23]|uniref:DUF1476 domain-containing protein n=1 Tax=Bradyrhizobium sp. CCGUVB23 TaxID=2949630 RepID=UPI0020B33CBA|nr:DUF1476 domain-containing protein [Bradyrhizobium sp. CCGUVB23]MCP3463353.1 DUF1476 domain-containing protein [Bradyrhizobium sp. CCGUVB23]
MTCINEQCVFLVNCVEHSLLNRPSGGINMTSFNERENAFEAEFAHREELKFRVREHAVVSLARWSAQRLGKSEEAIKAFTRETIEVDVTGPTFEPTIERIATALAPIGIPPQEVRQAMDRFVAGAEAAVRQPFLGAFEDPGS